MVKKILGTAALAATIFLLASAGAQAQRQIVRLTRFDGQTITGVAAEDMFRVELVKSDQTRAVVEIDAELERYVRLERRAGGVVSVRLEIPSSERRRFNRNNGWNGRTLKMTVYLPEIQSIGLKDMSRLTSNDSFDSTSTRIKIEDMSHIGRLELRADEASLELKDMSSAMLAVQARTLTAQVNDMSKLTVTGTVRQATATIHDMSAFNGSELHAERATVDVSDMSKASIHVTQYLYGRSRDMSSLRYEGNPREVDLVTNGRTIRTTNTR